MRAEDVRRTIPVLVFHSVSDRPGAGRWTLPRATFRRHVEAVAESGRTSVLFGELADGLAGRRPVRPGAVVLTFDDGFADNLDAAAVCGELGLQASVFVTTDYIGQPEMVTPAQLRELAALPNVEVGSHTQSHRRLDELQRREIARELCDSRARLEEVLSASVSTVAYPHGNYDERVKRSARAAGYRGAAAVRMALSHPADDPYAVSRYIVNADTTDEELRDVLAGRVVTAPGRERLVTFGYRWVRRARAIVRGGTMATPPVP